MNVKQKTILIGMILGDGFLQKTGENNARIRLEHSDKQEEYLSWKANQFPEFFQGKPQRLVRFNPVYQKQYSYARWQSNASPEIGRFRKLFYRDGKKIIPKELTEYFNNALSLAIWFMDDGYFYPRDKMSYIYIPKYTEDEVLILLKTLKINFNLKAVFKKKKRGESVLIFNTTQTKRLVELIKPFIIPSMLYKISLDPLSTAA
jgi:hypothetical protein